MRGQACLGRAASPMIIARLPRPHRIAAKIVIWLILLGTLLTIVYGVLGIIHVV